MSEFINALATWESYRGRWHESGNQIVGGECVAIATRGDGYNFFLVKRAGNFTVYAGCRHDFTIARYRRHARRYRRGSASKRRQTTAILDLFAAIVRSRK